MDPQVASNGGGNPITGWRVVQNLYSTGRSSSISSRLPTGLRRSDRGGRRLYQHLLRQRPDCGREQRSLGQLLRRERRGCRSQDDRRRGCPPVIRRGLTGLGDVEPARPAWSQRCGGRSLHRQGFAGAVQDRPRGTLPCHGGGRARSRVDRGRPVGPEGCSNRSRAVPGSQCPPRVLPDDHEPPPSGHCGARVSA